MSLGKSVALGVRALSVMLFFCAKATSGYGADTQSDTPSLAVGPHVIQKQENFSLYNVTATDTGSLPRKQVCILCRGKNSLCFEKMHIQTRDGTGYTVQRVSSQCGDCPQAVIDDAGGYQVVGEQFISNIDQSLTAATISGTNFVPSVFNPLLPGVLGFAVIILVCAYCRTLKRLWIGILVVVVLAGALLFSLDKLGPTPQVTVIKDFPVSFEKQIQNPGDRDPLECVVARPPLPGIVGLVSTTDGHLGTMRLLKQENQYMLRAESISSPGKYEGKINGKGFSANGTRIVVNLADWLPYLLLTFLVGIVFTYVSTQKYFAAPSKVLTISSVSLAAILTAIVGLLAQYNDNWGSPMQYFKAFLTGAAVTIGTKAVLAVALKAFPSLVTQEVKTGTK